MSENIAHIKATARRFWEEIWPNGDLAGLAEVLHPKGINHEAPPGISDDFEGTKQTMLWLGAAFSDQHYEVHQIVAEGDMVAVHLTHRGRHTGEFMGIPPTGREFANRHVHIMRFQDGRSIEHWAVRDDASLLRQLTGERPESAPAA
jgi:predicted ester cyclase